MNLQLLFTVLALIAAAIAAWGALRPKGEDGSLRDEIARARRDAQSDLSVQLGPLRQQLLDLGQDLASAKAEQLRAQSEALAARFQALNDSIQDALRAARVDQGDRLDKLQAQVQQRLEAIQKDSAEKLDKMRQTVDEKLHETLEKRLGESFNLVAQRLEQVQKGLGEMQTLANDVGGLKKILGNVKVRGTLGEVLLEGLLEQFLAPGQWERQKQLKAGSKESVDFALRLPRPAGEPVVWIPLDAKFPKEEFERLGEAFERGDLAGAEQAGQDLERSIVVQAKSIRDKYVDPPNTTNYALMYLPTEALYAEVVRRPGLFEKLQRQHDVVLVGPTTISAFLNMVQMGFTNLAISARSAEVWRTLGEVTVEFGRFGNWIAAVQKKIKAASDELEDNVGTRTRQLERRLKEVKVSQETAAPDPLPYKAEGS